MRYLILILLIIHLFSLYGQEVILQDDFSDGDFTNNPAWNGDNALFTINQFGRLQSNAATATTAYLSTPCRLINNAQWDFFAVFDCNPSSANFSTFYLTSNHPNPTRATESYYVVMGGTQDNVSLYVRHQGEEQLLIAGRENLLAQDANAINIRVTHNNGQWALYTKAIHEQSEIKEGEAQSQHIQQSNYCAISYTCTQSKGLAFSFDDIIIRGWEQVDNQAPQWDGYSILPPDTLLLTFNEPINIQTAEVNVTCEESNVAIAQIQSGQTHEMFILLKEEIDTQKEYCTRISYLEDISGNPLEGLDYKCTGIATPANNTTIRINEIMYEPDTDGLEYIEIINRTPHSIDMSNWKITTRKKDGTFNTGNHFPASTLRPHNVIGLTENAILLRNKHNVPDTANIVECDWKQSLSNEGTTIYLVSDSGEIADSVRYTPDWQHILVKNIKGVALERLHPDLPSNDATSWHSAASTYYYGTPGYTNSQYTNIYVSDGNTKGGSVWAEPEAFSPDGNGYEDICIIHCLLPEQGYIANVRIFTPSGLFIAELADNLLMATENQIIWDGTTNNGKNVETGIYALLFEAYHPSTGKRIKKKIPLIVHGQ